MTTVNGYVRSARVRSCGPHHGDSLPARARRLRPTLAAAAVGLAACAAPGVQSDTPQDGPIRDRSFYVCPDEVVFSVDVLDHAARVQLGDRVVRLPAHGVAAHRYGHGHLEVRIEGPTAWLTQGGEVLHCHAEGTGEVWRDAIRRGVVFRALGQEPGWLVEMNEAGRMAVLLDYGTEAFDAPVPKPTRTDGRLDYRTSTPAHAVRLLIEDRACHDLMSGEPFPAAVRVTVNGRSYRGCGLWLR